MFIGGYEHTDRQTDRWMYMEQDMYIEEGPGSPVHKYTQLNFCQRCKSDSKEKGFRTHLLAHFNDILAYFFQQNKGKKGRKGKRGKKEKDLTADR